MPLRVGRAEGEMEMLRLAAAGRCNRVIASELSVSPKIASVHMPNILAKPGVSTRTGAAATARRLYVLGGQ
jgi:DNA-binding CsgD family transcriptional regulator